jgi:hypothetical protein
MANQYSNNTRHIACNECGKQLTNMELSVYDLQWRYSGDMYCIAHETRQQFTSQYPVRSVSYTSYADLQVGGTAKIYHAIARPKKGGYTLLTAWYDTSKQAWCAYHAHSYHIARQEREGLHPSMSSEEVQQ